MKRGCIGICLVVLLIGCTAPRGFDRGALKKASYGPSAVVTDEEIERVLALKPQIRFPFRLAVYFSDRRGWYYGSRLEKEEKSPEWLAQLKADGIISEVIPIVSGTVIFGNYENPQYLKSIRLAAARHNADAVLIVSHAADVDRYNNPLACLYLTIIGGFFAPGTHSDALVIMNGALWDVRNEYLYLTVETEGEARQIGPAFLLEDDDVVKKARREALEAFRKEFVRRVNNLKGE